MTTTDTLILFKATSLDKTRLVFGSESVSITFPLPSSFFFKSQISCTLFHFIHFSVSIVSSSPRTPHHGNLLHGNIKNPIWQLLFMSDHSSSNTQTYIPTYIVVVYGIVFAAAIRCHVSKQTFTMTDPFSFCDLVWGQVLTSATKFQGCLRRNSPQQLRTIRETKKTA